MGFGKSYLYSQKHSFFSRLGFKYYGYPFLGSYVRSLYFKKFLPKKSYKKILDAGCGAGEYSFFLAEKFPNAKIYACDFFEKAVEQGKQTQRKMGLNNIKFFQHDLRNPVKETFDLVVSIDVLQDLSEKEKVLENLYNALGRKGVIFLHVPFFERKVEKDKKEISEELSGEKSSEKEILELVEKTGFKVVEKKLTFGFFAYLAWKLDAILSEKKLFLLRAFLLPFLKAFSLLDLYAENRKGIALMILAEKP